MQSKLSTLISKALILLWTLYVLLGYIVYRPYYFKSILESPAFISITFLVGLSILLVFIISRFHVVIKPYLVYLILLIFMLIIYHGAISNQEVDISSRGIFMTSISFLYHHIVLHAQAILIFLTCFCLGEIVQSNSQESKISLQSLFLSIVFGIFIFTILLFGLGVMGSLNRTFLLPIVIAVLLWRYKSIIKVYRFAFGYKLLEASSSRLSLALLLFIISVVSFYFVGAYKLFPLGFDSVFKYQNLSNLVYLSKGLISEGTPYYWSLFTAAGPVLFGSMSVSIFLSHSALILVLIGVGSIARKVLSPRQTLFLLALLVSFPGIAFLGFIDAKVDLGYIAVILAAILYYLDNRSVNNLASKSGIRFYIILGILVGFAMGVKYLAIIFIAGLLSAMLYGIGGIKLILANIFLFLGILFLFNIQRIGFISISPIEKWLIILVSLMISGFLFFSTIRSLPLVKVKRIVTNLFIFCSVAFIAFSPWVVKNVVESGSFNARSILLGSGGNIKLSYDIVELEKLGVEIDVPENMKNKYRKFLETKNVNLLTQSDIELFRSWRKLDSSIRDEMRARGSDEGISGKQIEIERFTGYEQGLMKYLSLPNDVTFSTNVVRNRSGDFGFLFLLLLPILLIASGSQSKWKVIAKVVSVVIIMLLSVSATFDHAGLTNLEDYLSLFLTDSYRSSTFLESLSTLYISFQMALVSLFDPIYVLMTKIPYSVSILLALGIFIFSISDLKNIWHKFSSDLKMITIIGLTYMYFWLVIANAIPFYGLPAIILVMIVVFYWAANIQYFVQPALAKMIKSVLYIGVVSGMVISFFAMFTNFNNKWNEESEIFEKSFLSHASKLDSEETTINNTLSNLVEIKSVLNQNIDEKIFRVGTFMNYHIADNKDRVFEDNQLNYFNRLTSLLVDKKDFITVLKATGFKYILFDLKSAQLDITKQSELLKRVQSFVSVLANNQNLDVAFTDRVVEVNDEESGTKIRKNGLSGKVVEEGSIAIFSIK